MARVWNGRWHVSQDGVPRRCFAADPQSCRAAGGASDHFASQQEAQEAYAAKMQAVGGLFRVKARAVQPPVPLREAALKQEEQLSWVRGGYKMTGAEIQERLQYAEAVLGALMKDSSTEALHSTVSPSGVRIYSEARARQHEEIVTQVMDKARRKGVARGRRALLSGGLGGAGKTTVMTMHLNIDPDTFLTVNPDDIKEVMAERGMIPKVKGLSPMEASPLAQNEACHISRIIFQRACQEGYDVILDRTMSTSGFVRQSAAELRQHGYQVQAVFVDISPQTSATRAQSRYRSGMDELAEGRGHGGRFLPSHLTQQQKPADPARFRSLNAENLVQCWREGVFDSEPVVFDNDGAAPVPVDFREFAHITEGLLE